MLPINNRLKKRKDFEAVFKKGKGWKEDFLYLKAAKNNLKSSRFGFVVSKKFSLKAVARNKMKRMLREAVKSKIDHIKKGIDIVIVVLPGMEMANYWQIEGLLNNLFIKSGILEK